MKKLSVYLKRVIVIGCGILTLLTVLLYAYTSFYARPTGDDLGFSYRAHRCWEETHSVTEVIKAAIEEVEYQRDACASDYTMVLFVSLMPEVFRPWTFWSACWFILLCLIISILVFSKEILVNRFHMPYWYSFLLGCMAILLILQEMPSTNSGMFWYSGAVHYPFAFSMALIFVTISSKYLNNGKKINLVLLCLLAIVIGGDGYFATVFLVSSFFFLLVYRGIIEKEKRIFTLILPFVVLLSCCLLCITGEGPSKIRTNGQLTFSVSLAIEAILNSIVRSVEFGFSWICEKFFIIPCMLVLGYVFLFEIKWENVDFEFKKPVLAVFSFFLIYASVYAPWVYSEFFDEFGASRGPENYCFYTFILFLFISMIYLLGYFRKKYDKVYWTKSRYVVGIMLLTTCLLFAYQNRHAIKTTHGYVGTEYILSNAAEDYKEQCEENMTMLLDPTVQDVELIQTNAFQGLLCNMVATENPDDFTSMVYSRFYGKESVIMK